MTELPPFALLIRAAEIHLAFASLVALAAWAVTSSRRVSATAKYWIWVATSINFLLPAGALIDRLRPPDLSWVLPLEDAGNAIARRGGLGAALVGVWAAGVAVMLVRLGLRLRADRLARASGAFRVADAFHARGVPVRFDADGGAPAVDGVLRPRISLPAGIERVLTAPELEAVLLHEVAHARRRDNLIRLVHEIGTCVFWFHPLVWLTGSRLSVYRELSCDESVIRGSRGRELVSALAKLANPSETLLLQAGAASYLGDRVARLALPPRTSPLATALRAVAFALVLVGCVLAAAFQANLMQRAAHGEFCSRGAAELAARPGTR
jgi:beta-lactamase regulating signal transducer with metallopeptidase domain